jgi:hypothetical protein
VIAWLLTGRWPVPIVPLLPDGPLRGLVAECTEPSPARRVRTVRGVRERLDVLHTTPALSPRAIIADLIQQAYKGTPVDVGQMLALARQHPDDGQLPLTRRHRPRRPRCQPCRGHRIQHGRQTAIPPPKIFSAA